MRGRPGMWLVVVSALHAASPLIVLGAHWWFGIDETVYLSQLNAHVPPGGFSAPRARGATLVAAPVTLLTSSVVAVRIWVAALSGLGLYFAFRPWLRLHEGKVVPLAALLFATLWTTIFYGFAVMPNEWVALAAVAACAYTLRFSAGGGRGCLAGLSVTMAAIALFRPSDAAYAGAALGTCCAFLPTSWRRRCAAAAAVALGALAGVADWVIEAMTRYGGLAARIHAAQAENGGGGLHFAGAAQLRALAGPALCRGSCHVSAATVYRLWWLVLTGLVVVGVVQARRHRRLALALLPLTVGLALAAQYVFTVTYAAPRFLLPTYALLSLPAASGVLAILRRAPAGRARVVVATALAGVLVVHTVLQVHVLTAFIAPGARVTAAEIHADADRLHQLGLHGPCLVLGSPANNQELAYATGCANEPRTVPLVDDAAEDGSHIVWLGPLRPPRSYDLRWRPIDLPGRTPSTRFKIYLSAGTA